MTGNVFHGGDVWQGGSPEAWLDYSANINPHGAPDWVLRALRRGLDNISYYPDPAMRSARAALADYLGLPFECALPTSGGISALELAMGCGARELLLATPCFGEYRWLAARRGIPARGFTLLDGRGGVRGLLKTLEAGITPGSLVCVCNPNNPVGAAFDSSEIMALLAAVERSDAWLLVDEAFIAYCPEFSVARRVPERERLMVAGSLTKILGIPGVRLGYLCAAAGVLERLSSRQLTWELNCFAAEVARDLPAHAADIAACAAESADSRESLAAELRALGLRVYDSRAPFLLCDLKQPAQPVAEALRRRGILVRQCMDFEGIADGRHIRLAVKGGARDARLVAELRVALCVN